MLLDVAIPGDRNVIQKEAEKILKYKRSEKKIHSMPSFGGEVKPSVPYRRYAACNRILLFTRKSESQAKLTGHFSPNSVLQ
jgi:hypothetical protein